MKSSTTFHQNSVKSKHTHKYIDVVSSIDRHNKQMITSINKNVGCNKERGKKEIRMDNELIRKYTDVVYSEYKINKPFHQYNNQQAMKDQIAEKIKVEHLNGKKQSSVSKKLIKLKANKNVLNDPQIQTESMQFAGSSNSKASINLTTKRNFRVKTQHNIDQLNQCTPIRPYVTGIRKRIDLTTAGTSHHRSKTGLTYQTHLNSNERGQFEKYHQEDIQISQFDQRADESNDSITKIDAISLSNSSALIKFKSRSKSINNSSIKNALPEKSQCVYCPVCESPLNSTLINQHEQICQQLQNLYELPLPELLQFVCWKVQQHQSIMLQHIAQTQKEKNSNIQNTIQKCKEQLDKCLWFQNIKTRLVQKSLICQLNHA